MQASKQGDSIVSVDHKDNPAVDRYHLLIDMINCITNELHLSISSLTTNTVGLYREL